MSEGEAGPEQAAKPSAFPLTEGHLVLARAAVRRHRGAHGLIAPDDMLSVAYEALCRAERLFDPEKGPFGPFASKTIDWALRTEIRKCAKVRAFLSTLVLDAAADVEQAALDGEAYEGATEALGALNAGYLLGSMCFLNGEDDLARRQERVAKLAALEELVGQLDEEHRELIAHRYFGEKPWSDVEASLGVPERTLKRWDRKVRRKFYAALVAQGFRGAG